VSDIRTAVPNRYDYIISTSTNIPLPVTGLSKLVQEIVMGIITKPGSDFFNPEYGMGIGNLLPATSTLITDQTARSAVAKGIMSITEQIMTNQRSVSLPDNERLQALALVDLSYDTTNMGWEVSVRVTAANGLTADATISVRS